MDLYHPKTRAVPGINRRLLAENYQQIFPNIQWDGRTFIVRVVIYAYDKFTWDGMSIPKMAQRYAGNPFTPKHELAGMVHDWLYFTGVYPRPVADLVMLRILELDGEFKFRRWAMYQAVSKFGWAAWDKHRELDAVRCKCKTIEDIINAQLTSKCPIHRKISLMEGAGY